MDISNTVKTSNPLTPALFLSLQNLLFTLNIGVANDETNFQLFLSIPFDNSEFQDLIFSLPYLVQWLYSSLKYFKRAQTQRK